VTVALSVRGLHVLFGGPRTSRTNGTVSESRLLVNPARSQSLIVPAGYAVGLCDVSFDVSGGECLAVLGESGAGKSSLLRTVAGLHPAAGGSVHVHARDVSALLPEQRSIVYLHQEPVLFPHLSVMENVTFPLTIRGIAKAVAMRRAVEWSDRLRILNVLGANPSELSGGERHRVALARALCADPAVLLLDEPLSSLDPAVRRDVRSALLAARAASGAAMILVTHDLDDAMGVASHIAAIGRSGDLSVPLASSVIVNSPPSLDVARLLGVFTEIPGAVVNRNGVPRFEWIGGAIPAAGFGEGSAIACVRAHELALGPTCDGEQPVLLVTARREAPHELSIEVQSEAGSSATLRLGLGTSVMPGDRVQCTVTNARLFSTV